RPARDTPDRPSRTPNTSANARVMARAPAPPVSTRVPSISKRTTFTAGSVVRLLPAVNALALAANVAGARSFRRRLFLEADALTFVQLVEVTLHRASMEEPLLAAVVANETEPPITDDPLDCAACHASLPGRTNAQDRIINIYSGGRSDQLEAGQKRR